MAEQERILCTQEEIIQKLTEAAEAFGIGYNATIVLLFNAIIKLSQAERMKPEKEQGRITAKHIVNAFLDELYRYYGANMQAALTESGLHSSEDIGKMVLVICEKGLLKKEEEDSLSDFNGLFTTADVYAYMSREKLKSRPVPPRMRKVINLLLIGGLLVVLVTKLKFIAPETEPWGWFTVTAGIVLSVWHGRIDLAQWLGKDYIRR